MKRLRVAMVAPTLRILGGHAVQADRLLDQWRNDPDVEAWLVPINPIPPRPFRWTMRVKFLRTAATELVYLPLLCRELRRADVVHIFSASYLAFVLAPLPAIAIAKALGKPVIVNYHSGEAPDHLRRSFLARTVLRRINRNVVQSRFLHEVFAAFGLDAAIVPNTIDFERFRFRARTAMRPRLVSTRNLDRLYNVACTLRAFRLVQDRYPSATLTIVGFGPEERMLRQLADELDLRGVTFTGRVAPAEMHRYYDEADIFVQTPDIDNMPLSLLEAFASGVPVVSTGVGGIPAILRDGQDGLLAAAGDHEAVARQVLRLLDDSAMAERLAASARASCAAYDWQSVREAWLQVYRAVAAAAAGDLVETASVSPPTAGPQPNAGPQPTAGAAPTRAHRVPWA
jgi:glycosyltransferase involved in cell wall biosynthesis